jgi:hypothetical protein
MRGTQRRERTKAEKEDQWHEGYAQQTQLNEISTISMKVSWCVQHSRYYHLTHYLQRVHESIYGSSPHNFSLTRCVGPQSDFELFGSLGHGGDGRDAQPFHLQEEGVEIDHLAVGGGAERS